jgi:1,4-alpha-glucan branching enzyme
LSDIELPYENLRAAGGLVEVRFQYRPRDPRLSEVFLVGDFNNWAGPGSRREGRHHLMRYDAVRRYWVLELWLAPGVYEYLYLLEGREAVADPKSAIEGRDGRPVGRLLVRAPS